jgi:hypothetical protein
METRNPKDPAVSSVITEDPKIDGWKNSSTINRRSSKLSPLSPIHGASHNVFIRYEGIPRLSSLSSYCFINVDIPKSIPHSCFYFLCL